MQRPLLLVWWLLLGLAGCMGSLARPCGETPCQSSPREACDDGLDNDGDSLRDCDDVRDCIAAEHCAQPGQVRIIELGAVLPAHEVRFTIPEGALGVTLTAQGAPADVLALSQLVRPDGELLISSPSDPSPRQFLSCGAFAFSLSPNGGVQAGEWRATFFSSNNHALSVRALVREGPFNGGLLPLNVYLPEGLRACAAPGCEGGYGTLVTPENAASLDEIKGALSTLSAQVYGPQAGLWLGELRFFALPASYVVVSSQDELDALSQESARGGDGLHIFFVQDFTPGPFPQGVVGISPSIPGAISAPGTRISGVVVSLTGDAAQSQNLTGLVLAHELGHFLGLWHTSEFGGEHDQLSDTPACSGDTMSTPQDALSCPDSANVMFPLLSRAAGGLSSEQNRILHGSSGYLALAPEPSP